jgi:hypothetical protein
MRSGGILKLFGALGLSVCASLLAARIDRAPVDRVVVALFVGVVGFLILALAFYYHMPRRLWSLLELDAIVVSALVFDGEKVLLVRDEELQPPWLVPPSAHVGFFTSLRGGPHQAVIRTVKSEVGIDIEMPAYPVGQAVTQMALPVFAQSEKQWSGEGHDTHHDFYYVASLARPRKAFGARGAYDWYVVEDLDRLQDAAIPHEMIKVIKDARNSMNQPRVQ